MCQMLTRLPFNNENAINLRCVEANQSWWSALVWQDDAFEKRLRSIMKAFEHLGIDLDPIFFFLDLDQIFLVMEMYLMFS